MSAFQIGLSAWVFRRGSPPSAPPAPQVVRTKRWLPAPAAAPELVARRADAGSCSPGRPGPPQLPPPARENGSRAEFGSRTAPQKWPKSSVQLPEALPPRAAPGTGRESREHLPPAAHATRRPDSPVPARHPRPPRRAAPRSGARECPRDTGCAPPRRGICDPAICLPASRRTPRLSAPAAGFPSTLRDSPEAGVFLPRQSSSWSFVRRQSSEKKSPGLNAGAPEPRSLFPRRFPRRTVSLALVYPLMPLMTTPLT